MRLSDGEIAMIREAAREVFGPAAVVRLFGSRVDDRKRGGDIDLHVELRERPADDADGEFLFWDTLQARLGEQRIDIVVQALGVERPIDAVAKSTGVVL